MKTIRMFFRIRPDVLDRCLQNPSFCEDVLIGDEEGCDEVFDADEAFDAIHFVISLNRAFSDQGIMDDHVIFDHAIVGMKPVHRRLDLGRGPAHYNPPDTVLDIAASLDELTQEELRERYDPEVMDAAEVYPEKWMAEGEAAWDYIWQHFQRLRDFYRRAAAARQAVVTWVVPRGDTVRVEKPPPSPG